MKMNAEMTDFICLTQTLQVYQQKNSSVNEAIHAVFSKYNPLVKTTEAPQSCFNIARNH